MKLLFSIVLIVLSTSSFAQADFNKWSVGFSFGAHDGMNYLVQKGVESDRLHPEGYGESMPKTSRNCRWICKKP